MKYWRGFLVAAIIMLCTWALKAFCAAHTELVDMVYPYVDRIIMDYLAGWSANFAGCLWQTILVFFMVLIVASVALMVILRWNPVQLTGWILALCCLYPLLETGVYGINQYAGPVSEDIRLEVHEYSLSTLERAAVYYRDKANEYVSQVPRNTNGTLRFSSFEKLASEAGQGFDVLAYERFFPIYTGTTIPVKELTWADRYDGVTGITVGLTGESAVNPNVPAVGLPYAICHEMSHRMCIYNDTDADFSAFLACTAHPSVEYTYSGYLMAFRACYNGLNAIQSPESKQVVSRLMADADPRIAADLEAYNAFLGDAASQPNTDLCKLLVSWHIQEVVSKEIREEEEIKFDPMDETDDRLESVVNPYPTEVTDP